MKKIYRILLAAVIIGLIFSFFMIGSSIWWITRQIQLSFYYSSPEKTTLSLAIDCNGHLSTKDYLIINNFVLPPQSEFKKITLNIPATKRKVLGLYIEHSAGDQNISIRDINVSNRKKQYAVNIPGDVVFHDGSVEITSNKLNIPPDTKVMIGLTKSARSYYAVNWVRFSISFAAILLFVLLFSYRVSLQFKLKSIPSLLFAVVAIGIMILPAIHMDCDTKVSKENRFLQPFPHITDENGINLKFPKQAENFLNDRFYQREKMIDINNILFNCDWFNVFQNSYINKEKAIQCKDYWMFDKTYNNIEMIQHKNRFTDDELKCCAEHMTQLVEVVKKKFNAQVYFVLMPDKESVYEEFYPDFLLRQRKHPESRLQQLVTYLKHNSDLNVICPLPQLLNAKQEKFLYYKTGTHQTPYGGYISALEIQRFLKRDFPELIPLSSNILRWQKSKNADVDIAYLLGYKDPMNDLPASVVTYDTPVFASEYTIKNLEKSPSLSLLTFHYSSKNSKGIKALVVSDSFWAKISTFMEPVLSEQYHVFFGDGRNFFFEPIKNDLQNFHFDIVIIESTERFIHRFMTIKY